MVGYDRQAAFKEVEPLLSEEELTEVEEEGNIPKHDYLTELYGEFEEISKECIAEHVETIGLLTAMKEKENCESTLVFINGLIRQSIELVEISRKEILNDRKTLAGLKRVSR